jgi:hypothetical protein
VLPNEVSILRQFVEPSVRVFHIRESVPHTDHALLTYFGCKPYLGGRVERDDGKVVVVRHTS